MKKSVTISIVAVSLLLLLSACSGQADGATPAAEASPLPAVTPAISQGTQVGNMAPDFHLNNLEGKPVSLSELRGKVVLINFWATWCPFCRAERPVLQQIYNDWQSKGLVVLTIDIIGSTPSETAANIATFMQNNNYSFPVLLDVNMQVTKSYNIKNTPTTFLIDKAGIIREVRVGAYPSQAAMEESLNRLLAR